MGLRMGQVAQGVCGVMPGVLFAAWHACVRDCGLRCLAGCFMMGDQGCEAPVTRPDLSDHAQRGIAWQFGQT